MPQSLGDLVHPAQDRHLSAKDVVTILRAAKDCGVASLELGDLRCAFHLFHVEHSTESGDKPSCPAEKQIPEEEVEKPVTLSNHEVVQPEEMPLLRETIETRKTQIEALLVENPEEYEDLIASGDLIDEKSTDDSGS